MFSTTNDGYYISVKNRIVLTGNFDATTIPGVETAPFFANGDDARTKGLDVVLSYKTRFDENLISATFTGNFNDREITDVKNAALDEQAFFRDRDQAFLLASAPDSKISLNLNYGRS